MYLEIATTAIKKGKQLAVPFYLVGREYGDER